MNSSKVPEPAHTFQDVHSDQLRAVRPAADLVLQEIFSLKRNEETALTTVHLKTQSSLINHLRPINEELQFHSDGGVSLSEHGQ